MRIVIVFMLFAALFSCPVFAYSDIGLLKSPRTLSYFLLVPTDFSSISSGLVYNHKQNDRLMLEASYTSYKSFYLLTNNITKIRLNAKYKLLEFGPASLTGLGGMALYYAPSVGLGLAGDVGGIVSINILKELAAALLINGIIFRDGIEINAEPAIYYTPGFLMNTELYVGLRIEGSMVGFANDGSSGGKFNFNINAGARVGI
ncbi:MAG: hypothetical protein FD145_1142 [Candidatus Saganbacteria bacterium]|uniref:Uncharacterized protein n=1 Tax=Candidatus Saganbacteria bacterium TaxID=2575572 RepID=A0A833P2Y1_UNCSA|nr:MAG: hypothetical protein FD145_1142 [Candidatus Saganbacteria bacterium]